MLTGMEVANASMYDGSTGDRRGGADGASRHQAAARRCSSGGLHPHYARGRRDAVAHGRATTVVALPPDAGGERGSSRAIDDETVLRRRADAGLSSAICAT